MARHPNTNERSAPAEESRRRAANHEHSSSSDTGESPAVSSSADLPPNTALRNRSTGPSRADTGRWKSVRPWKPPAMAGDSSQTGPMGREDSEEEGSLSLEVIDVSSTAIALGIFGLQSQMTEGASTPNISIRLNSAPWPHVFHSPASDDDDHPNDRETIVVYGLEPGHEYEVELAVVGVHGSAGIPFTTPAAAHDASPVEVEAEPEDAPPPYSPSPMPAQATETADISSQAPQPTEASLRAQVKKIRADAKLAETALHGSISALQRALERAAKDDQKTKQRLIALDDGAKKLKEAAARDQIDAEEALAELPEIEKTATKRQQQAATRKIEVQLREKEVSEQLRQDDETIVGLTRLLEELKERTEGVRQESERYEREVIEDLTARLAHLDQQLQTGEISPSFLSTAPGLGGHKSNAKSSTGIKGRDRKSSNAASKNPHANASAPPTTAGPPQPRIVPGWKNPHEKHAALSSSASSQHSPISAGSPMPPPITPPLLSAPHHGPIGPPSASPKEEKAEEKSAWRFGSIGEQFGRTSQKTK